MPSIRTLGLCLALGLLSLVAFADGRSEPSDLSDLSATESISASRPTVAVSDLAGSDRELSHFLADTLLTDLTQSNRMQMIERTEVQQVFADLEIAPASPITPSQARQIGRRIKADRLLVGSYLVRDGQAIINVRLLDTQTGLVIPGGGMNVEGDKRDMLGLTQKLARMLHRRVTGVDLVFGGASGDGDAGAAVASHVDLAPAVEPTIETAANGELDALRQSGMVPVGARANAPLTERDLMGLVRRLAHSAPVQTEAAVTSMQPSAPVTRMRALTALAKLLVSPDDIAEYRLTPPADMPPDMAATPTWGAPYLAAAVDQGWWAADKAFRPRETATWAFVGSILTRMPISPKSEAPGDPDLRTTRVETDSEIFTGLIVDGAGFTIERDMNARILDEDGRLVYPDVQHVPSIDYLEDNGMAAYCQTKEDAKRAGKHPLEVQATAVTGPGHDDVVVSNETAQRIRDANKRSHFLWRWSVAIVIGGGAAADQANAAP